MLSIISDDPARSNVMEIVSKMAIAQRNRNDLRCLFSLFSYVNMDAVKP